jgi:uncharacterized protein YodC (DUF2158 family)
MAEKKFESGDSVRLKSGGPKMNISVYNSMGQVVCNWFDGAVPKTGRFLEAQLELADDKPSGGTKRLERA